MGRCALCRKGTQGYNECSAPTALIQIVTPAGAARYKACHDAITQGLEMTDGMQIWLRNLGVWAALLMAAAAHAQAQAQAAGPWPLRGELLYQRHCGGCHSEQMHWRNKKLATDWDTLKAEVARWQATDRLGWSELEIVDVARYLNETIYRYPQTSHQVSLLARQR
jgi:mono/diheme cytochrome c family protein